MLWPFNHFRKPHAPQRGTIRAIYGMIVAQAREPLFYRAMGVPDTVNGLTLGRFFRSQRAGGETASADKRCRRFARHAAAA
jgi:hypothetical protein